MKAYVISLEPASPRVQSISDYLHGINIKSEVMQAIAGTTLSVMDYFNNVAPYFRKNRQLLSPAEVGCALSHIATLQKFLSTSEEYALILEDDVILTDDFAKSWERLSFLSCDFLHLGGMDGISSSLRSLHGYRRVFDGINLWEIPRGEHQFLVRAVAYRVNRAFAVEVCKSVSHYGLIRPDDYYLFSERFGINSIFHVDLVRHPVSLEFSSIEAQRIASTSQVTSVGLLHRVRLELLRTLKHRFFLFRRKIDVSLERVYSDA